MDVLYVVLPYVYYSVDGGIDAYKQIPHNNTLTLYNTRRYKPVTSSITQGTIAWLGRALGIVTIDGTY